MKKLTFITTAIAVSLAASFLMVSATALSAIAGVVSPAARNEGRPPPLGMYVNAEAGFGSSEITFLADGRYTYGDEGSVSAEGIYKVKGNQIVFTEYGPADAACLHLAGKYTWAFAGKDLVLKEVEDPCATRRYDWGFGDWFKQR